MNKINYVIFKVGQWYKFELIAANGRVLIATPNKYCSRLNAQKAIVVLTNLVKSNPITIFK